MSVLCHAILIILSCIAVVNSYQTPRFRSSSPYLSAFLKPSFNFQARQISKLSAAIPSLPVHEGGVNWWVWSLLATSSSLGIISENTKIGSILSSPLVTMGISLILCNTGMLPSSSPVYNTVMKVFVPLAVPLLLLDADLRKCFKSTGTLLKAFLIGSVGTFLGTLIAYSLVPMKGIVGSHKIASALCARHIGGAVNFVAVSDILQTSPELVAAALAADNVVVAFYLAFLFAISLSSTDEELSLVKPKQKIIGEKRMPSEVTLRTISIALSLGFILCAISQSVGSIFSIPPMLLVSFFAVLAATLFPKAVGSVSASGGVIGVLFMQMFFAVTGAMGHIPTVIKIAPSLFLHTLIQIIVHFTFSMGVGKFLKVSIRETVLASNANVGGPTTAAAMASNKRWKELVLPALLTGIFGYAIATGLGVLVSNVLPLIPTL